MDLGSTRLIINADDLGLNPKCTEAILEAFDHQFISSATMVANGSYFEEAVERCRQKHLETRVGIHLNLTEGSPLTEGIKNNPNFCDDLGILHGRIDRLKPLAKLDREHVAEELSAQIERMRNHGFPITHADSHHHIHTGWFIGPVAFAVLKKHRIGAVRIHRNIGEISALKRMVKMLYNFYLKQKGFQAVDRFGSFEDVLFLKARPGGDTLEIMVHPDYGAHGDLIDRVGHEVAQTSRSLREEWIALATSRLYSYADVWMRP